MSNPLGIGGLQTRPHDINKKGRPKETWGQMLEAVGEEIEPKSGKPFKELVSRRLWVEAVNGNLGAIREIFNRMEGLPKNSNNIEVNVPVQINNKIEDVLDKYR